MSQFYLVLFAVPASLFPSRMLNSTPPRENKSLKRFTSTKNASQYTKTFSSSNRKVDTTYVSAGRRLVGAAHTPQGDDKSLNVCGKAVSQRSFQDDGVGYQAPEGENITLIRDHKSDESFQIRPTVQHLPSTEADRTIKDFTWRQ